MYGPDDEPIPDEELDDLQVPDDSADDIAGGGGMAKRRIDGM
ncbi:MAG: hypothetical protein R2737_15990 [Candidatus Nanopelagicales bacterium]